jgi:hypothetical protein
MDPDRIDFSALDPARDELRWERRVRTVVARAATRPVERTALRFARPLLAVAAALALLAWAPSLFGTGALPAQAGDAAVSLSQWAAQGEVPAGADVWTTFGGHDGAR